MVDDTLLYDDDIKGNFFHTFDCLKLCGDNGITFNEEKFQFCQMEVEFAGFRVTADGMKPSESILKDVDIFPEPTTIREARSCLHIFGVAQNFITTPLKKDFVLKKKWTHALA